MWYCTELHDSIIGERRHGYVVDTMSPGAFNFKIKNGWGTTYYITSYVL